MKLIHVASSTLNGLGIFTRTSLFVGPGNSPLSFSGWAAAFFGGASDTTCNYRANNSHRDERDLFSAVCLICSPLSGIGERIQRRNGWVFIRLLVLCSSFGWWMVEFPLKNWGALDRVMLFLAKCRFLRMMRSMNWLTLHIKLVYLQWSCLQSKNQCFDNRNESNLIKVENSIFIFHI